MLLAGLLAASGCRTLTLVSDHALGPVETDGRTTEWSPSSTGQVNEENVQVAARNDDEQLYVMVRFRANDDKWTRPCAMTGLTLWLNRDGRKRERTGIRFVAGPNPESLPRPTERDRPPEGMGSIRKLPQREHDGMLVFLDREAETTAVLPADGTRGPRAGFTCADGLCSYEFSFPLAPATPGRFGLGVGPGATVMVGLTAGPDKEAREVTRQQRPGNMAGKGGGGGRGGGRPGGGRGGPGGGPAGGGQRPTSTENPELWVKVRLVEARSESEEDS